MKKALFTVALLSVTLGASAQGNNTGMGGNDGNYQSVTDQTRSDLQDDLSASVLQNAFSALLQSAGGFKEFSKTKFISTTPCARLEE